MEREAFARVLARPQIVASLFLPIDQARWVADAYTLGPTPPPSRGQFAGVRLRAADPDNVDAALAGQVQGDLTELVRSVVELRKTPQLASLVLSPEIQISRDNAGVYRARFGLRCPPGGVQTELDAARECHRVIGLAIRRAGLRVDHPAAPDASRGFDGLASWASELRLKPGLPLVATWWPWLLVAGLLLLLARGCVDVAALSG